MSNIDWENIFEELHKDEEREVLTSFDELVEMVQSVREGGLMTEKPESPVDIEKGDVLTMTLPKFVPTESWGDPSSEARKQIDAFLKGIPKGGLQGRLDALNEVMKVNKNLGPRRIIGSLIILESLAAVIQDFSASSAGFVFEGFLAALLGGEQKGAAGSHMEDIFAFGTEEKGGVPMSLKLLTPGGDTKGSFANLVTSLDEWGEMRYIVAYKELEAGVLKIFEFSFTQKNIVPAMLNTGTNAKLVKDFLYNKTTVKKKEYDPEEEKVFHIKALEAFNAAEAEGWQNWDKTFHYLHHYSAGAKNSDQWYLSPTKLNDAGVDFRHVADININPEELKRISSLYIDIIGVYIKDMFNSLDSLSRNINYYVSQEDRAQAIGNGATPAVQDAKSIQTSTLKQISKEKA